MNRLSETSRRPAVTEAAAIRLTSSAERYTTNHGLAKAVAGLALGQAAATGDLVRLEADGKTHDFTIVGRAWIAAGDRAWLELTLDHPVRRGG